MINIENILYAYLLICASMIVFNIVCIFSFHQRDQALIRHSKSFEKKIQYQMECEIITTQHKKYLIRKLSHVRYLMAFEKTIEDMRKVNVYKEGSYLNKLRPQFLKLAEIYSGKNKLQAAYYLYFIQKYAVFEGVQSDVLTNILMDFVRDENLYCRENALQAIYSTGNCKDIVHAVLILNDNACYHNQKLITDGLYNARADHKKLGEMLWRVFDRLNPFIAVAVLNYFRFKSGDHKEQMLRILKDRTRNREVIFSCIRYFGKYPYEPAWEMLMEYAENRDELQWEAETIACSALASYPNEKTIALLKRKVYSRNWYTRYNASQSLTQMGLNYNDLIDIIDGADAYASDMLRYRLEQKNIMRKKAKSAS